MRLQQHASHRTLTSVTPISYRHHAAHRAATDTRRAPPTRSLVLAFTELTLVRRAQRGQPLELSDVPVPDLLAAVQALVEPFAATRGVSLVVDCEHAPAFVRAERTALLWVLMNLADNAVTCTPTGGRVVLSALVVPHAVELRVAGTAGGEGRDSPFTRLDACARDLTRLMGGQLLDRSAAGMGSQVAVRFARAWGPAQSCADASTAKAA